MKDYQAEFPVGMMCRVFKVSKSAFYGCRNYLSSPRHGENRLLLSQIKRILLETKSRYGSPRIAEELRARGFKVSRPRVARLMKQHGLRAVHAKKFVVTTDSKHKYPVVENKLNRDFSAQGPGQKWVSDITYIRTAKGWLYLTVIVDLFDRKVVGWAQSSNMTAQNTSMAAWKMAVKNRPLEGNLLFHSDRGVQYACQDFTHLLSAYHGVQRSMSRKGNCWDNAVAESFFKSLKIELVYQMRFETKEQAAVAVFEWIETWYNRTRRHAAIGNKTINEFHAQLKMKKAA